MLKAYTLRRETHVRLGHRRRGGGQSLPSTNDHGNWGNLSEPSILLPRPTTYVIDNQFYCVRSSIYPNRKGRDGERATGPRQFFLRSHCSTECQA